MAGSSRQAVDRAARAAAPPAARIVSVPTASLSWKTSPARIDSMIAGVPPSSRCVGVVEVAVVVGVDVGDRAAAGHVRHPVGEQLAPRDEHAGRRRAADELVRREEDRVLVGQRVAGPAARHLDVDVRRRGGEVPEGQRAVLVQQRRRCRRCRRRCR